MRLLGRLFTGVLMVVVGFAAIAFFAGRQEGSDIAAPGPAPAEAPASLPEARPAPSPVQIPEGVLPENANLHINTAGLDIIKESEGLRLEAYNLNGQWLIGYGHSATAKAGMKITDAEATALLRSDVLASENGVKKRLTVSVNENEFSAMVSLAYNLGVGGFGRSSVLERINAGDRKGAADAFLRHNKGGGKVIEHLTHRREKERALFLTPV